MHRQGAFVCLFIYICDIVRAVLRLAVGDMGLFIGAVAPLGHEAWRHAICVAMWHISALNQYLFVLGQSRRYFALCSPLIYLYVVGYL